jgi:hypothetical protein
MLWDHHTTLRRRRSFL